MSRPVFVILFLAFALQASQAQLFSHGAPASVLSPTPDGVQHGAPASVVSPAPLAPGVHTQQLRTGGAGVHVRGPMRHFGSSHNHQQQVFVPIPLFYSVYGDGAYPSPADPYVADNQPDPAQTNTADANPAPANQTQADQRSNQPLNSDDELRAAYLQGAHDAMSYQGQGNSRYGEHYLDSRENGQQASSSADRKPRQEAQPEFSVVPVEDKTPTTVFIFKDGHQFETKNYAIMGGTLFDFSGAMLRKIKLDDLDSPATVKANDDRGVQVKLN